MKKIAITGATGQLGRLVINQLKLKTEADNIIALARSVDKATELGVSVREANYDKPETLTSALAGIDTLLLISSSEIGKRAQQHHNVIEAAKDSGVRRIVYTSLLHADSSTLDLAEEHLATEAEIKASGIPYTILRNGWYTENYTASIPAALAGGAFIGSAGNGRIASAPRSDYAAAAVAVLTGEGHINQTYELAGEKSYTLSDLAAEISRQSGKTIPYLNLPESDYAEALAQAGVPVDFAKAIAGWDVAASQGALAGEGKQLAELIGRAPTSLEAAVKTALEQA